MKKSKKDKNVEKYILKAQVHFGSLKTSVPKGTVVVVDRKNKTVEINGVPHDNISDVDLGIKAGCIIPYVEGETEVLTAKVKSIQDKQDGKFEVRKSEVDTRSRDVQDGKFEVQKSDLDLMPKEIDISNTKKEVRDAKRKKITVSYEKKDDNESRGLKVVTNEVTGMKADTPQEIMRIVNGDDDMQEISKIRPKTAAKKPFGLSSTEDAKDDVAAQINGEGTVVKKIGKGDSGAKTEVTNLGEKLVAKRPADNAASKEKAKAAAEARKASIAAKRAAAKKKEG